MKRNYVSSISLKTTVRSLFFTLAVVVFSLSANAQALYASNTNANPGAVVTYLGTEGDQMSFRLKFENESGEKFAVTIADSDGTILFDEIFTDKKFNKVFKTPAEIGKLTFTISDPKNKSLKKIEISTEKRMVEEVYVTKIG
jgi:hypothetical protein